MNILTAKTDERIETVYFTRDAIVVDLIDGRTISAPLTWYPRLLKATVQERNHWIICGGGYGIHWPDIDEDLSIAGLLRGAPAPNVSKAKITKKIIKHKIQSPCKRSKSSVKKKRVRVH